MVRRAPPVIGRWLGELFTYIKFFKGGLRGLGCRLGRRWTVATGDHRPFVSPTGERSHLPVRSALGKRHWRLTPPPYPLLRGVCLYLAASFANAKLDRVSCTKCNLTRAHIPPKGVLSPGYRKGVPKGRSPFEMRCIEYSSPSRCSEPASRTN